MIERRTTIPFSEARQIVTDHVERLKPVSAELFLARGRVLAESIYAPFPSPYFRRSGYDGFAICAEDDHDFPITLDVVAEIPCGATYNKRLNPGEAVRIMTGAKVPEGADKIIMLEQSQTTEKSNEIRLINTQPSSNITEIGTEFQKGDLLLEKGHQLNAGSLSLLASFGITEVKVWSKPKVAILSTGSELVAAGEKLPNGKIYNSNEPLLVSLAEEYGAEVVYHEALSDDYEVTLTRLREIAGKVDLILTTGGVSVGDFDFMAEIAKHEARLLFNKIQMRPGSPTTAMIFEDTLLIALSGNPGACFTGFHLFVEPVIRKFSGEASSIVEARGVMARDYLKNNGYDRFLRGKANFSEGKYQVEPVGSDMSSALGNLPFANCLIMIPRGKVGKAKGEEVRVWLLSSKL
ncbi:molybdopterin molybdotransferase MoeA [Listeria aquatica]|uniref:Molybdopterin molybdenumtransferase n=1 Tax=Listeria aquatica TaxID=1494960 RepID=A0A841ZMB0_9LIST|nr:gephyrin-like molybdotransferase Glp [Listeria aquatica]MBC1520642.1 molybdopterin molybdotransferase MoeA [Listeria aquatica]